MLGPERLLLPNACHHTSSRPARCFSPTRCVDHNPSRLSFRRLYILLGYTCFRSLSWGRVWRNDFLRIPPGVSIKSSQLHTAGVVVTISPGRRAGTVRCSRAGPAVPGWQGSNVARARPVALPLRPFDARGFTPQPLRRPLQSEQARLRSTSLECRSLR